MTTPVCSISETGISVPAYADCLAYFTSGMQSIYGSDLYVGADSQDGQWLGVLALALSDTNAACEAAYNAQSPSTAQGCGLSTIVQINGISRLVPTFSTLPNVLIGGTFGTVITNGVVSDGTNNWNLPATVTIPQSGQILVTVTAQSVGAINIGAGQINTAQSQGSIVTPTYGWQSAMNLTASTPGAPVETDAALRTRQAKSTMIPANTILDGLVGAISALSGVTNVVPYENDGDVPDANGIPGHTISLVITGGIASQIASTIAAYKGQGVNTYGTSTQQVTNAYGITRTIAWFQPVLVPVSFVIVIKPLTGFTTDIQSSLVNAIAAWVNGLGVGQNVLLGRAYVPANLSGAAGSLTYEIVSVAMARNGAPTAAADVSMAFYEQPSCDSTYIQIQLQTS